LLRQHPSLLPAGAQEHVTRFLQARIEEARLAEAGSWSEHLGAALDYRTWHVFELWRRDGGGSPERVTERTHRQGSGGEKAVTLHLPLFAAAAVAYDSAREGAPRLVMLDEAFAGIDDGMRGRCMAILVDLDLDVMMTNHEMWGMYAEVPALSVYNLSRHPEVRGVFAERFVWNGETLVEAGQDRS
jgi:hypothetical protein